MTFHSTAGIKMDSVSPDKSNIRIPAKDMVGPGGGGGPGSGTGILVTVISPYCSVTGASSSLLIVWFKNEVRIGVGTYFDVSQLNIKLSQ